MVGNSRRLGIRRAAACVCLCALLLCAVNAGEELRGALGQGRYCAALRELYGAENQGDRRWRPAALAEGEPADGVPPAVQEDFRALYAVNDHLVGWLVAGEGIDLPVVQFDNAYYLSHNFHGDADMNGALFVNEANSLWPPDDVILIHGHNMKSGAQFGTLRRFERFDYASGHPLVCFRTIFDEAEVYYALVAAFNASMNEDDPEYFDIGRLRFEGGDAFADYLASVQSQSIWRSPIDARPGDALLMLVTCSYYQENGRFALLCRRLRGGETPEEILSEFQAGEPCG